MDSIKLNLSSLIPKNIFGWVNLLLDLIIIVTLIYMMAVPIPQETKALKECNERLLCKYGDLKGKICDNYEIIGYKNYDINITIP